MNDRSTHGPEQSPLIPSRRIVDRELSDALHSLREGSEEGDSSDSGERMIARIAWSRILEPGDGTAGALIGSLGAAEALRLLLDDAPLNRLRSARSTSTDIPWKALSAAFERWTPRLDRNATLEDMRRAAQAGLSPLFPEDPAWPERLNDLGDHAPVMLWVRGQPETLRLHSIAIVGARAATSYGTHITTELTSGVCAAGAAVVSGAAYGVDAAAHRAALAAGAPTVAVLAGGVDRPYPLGNSSLIERIAESGAVCAEVVPGTAPTRWRFLQRNRIVAALSDATLVTEAGSRSGSLNTAGHAAHLGRMLGAVPGPVTSAASAGCHRLIREYDATLVASPRDACELLGLDLAREPSEVVLSGEAPPTGARTAGDGSGAGRAESSQARQGQRTPLMHQRILDAIPLRGGRALNPIVQLSGVSARDARAALAELELLGLVEQRKGAADGEPRWGLRRIERAR